jgi:DNA (cytosine-5)-methyltransferase 1
MGGIGLGLRGLGYEVGRAFDSWDQAVAIYNHNFGEESAEECNLLSAAGRTRVSEVAKSLGDIELLAAGPPCKGFSQLRNGRHDGRNGHNRVLAAMPDYIATIRPRVFLIENVPELLKHRKGQTFRDLLPRLEKPADGLKYCVTHGVFDAALFGTPQARRRVLILGVREGEELALPKPGPDLMPLYAALRHGTRRDVPEALRPHLAQLDDPNDLVLTTAKQALSDLPVLQPGSLTNETAYWSEARTAFQQWIRKGADSERVRDMRPPGITPKAEARLEFIDPGKSARSIPKEQLNGLSRRYDSAYRRLHPDVPSTSLSTKYDCVYHYTQPRSLSVREYARLQGIPDRVTFPDKHACRRSAYEMIGNSVPPRLIEGVLGEALRIAEHET